nr:hypothetical protein [Nostoc sp. CreGUA01]
MRKNNNRLLASFTPLPPHLHTSHTPTPPTLPACPMPHAPCPMPHAHLQEEFLFHDRGITSCFVCICSGVFYWL